MMHFYCTIKHEDNAAESNRQMQLRIKEEVQTSSAELHSGQRKKGGLWPQWRFSSLSWRVLKGIKSIT
jgi:hypothetical protein